MQYIYANATKVSDIEQFLKYQVSINWNKKELLLFNLSKSIPNKVRWHSDVLVILLCYTKINNLFNICIIINGQNLTITIYKKIYICLKSSGIDWIGSCIQIYFEFTISKKVSFS